MYEGNQNAVVLFDTAAEANAAETAFIRSGTGESYTYADVRDRSRRVADGLRDQGVDEGDFVTFLADLMPEYYVFWFGCLRAGAVPAPLHPHETSDRVAGMYGKVDADTLVYHDAYADLASEAGLFDAAETVIALDGPDGRGRDPDAFVDAASSAPIDREIAPEDTACVFFSSGTTGVPKPIAISHFYVVEISHMFHIPLRCTRQTTYLNAQSTSFSAQFPSMAPLSTGATVVTLSDWDPSRALGAIDEYGVTTTLLVPVQFKQILDVIGDGEHDTSSLDVVASAASRLHPSLKDRIRAQLCPDVSVVYAATECGIVSYLLPEEAEGRDDSVGKPVPNMQVRVVDPEREEGALSEDVEPGEAGEIVARGLTVSEGIYDDPAATREKLTEDGWCFTGDVGRRDDEGYLYLQGRVDNMIVTGGINVFAEEVEGVLETHPKILDAAVIGVPDEEWSERVKAVLVTEGDLSESDVVRWCKDGDRLAPHEVPKEVSFVDGIPRNNSGKKDRNRLKESD